MNRSENPPIYDRRGRSDDLMKRLHEVFDVGIERNDRRKAATQSCCCGCGEPAAFSTCELRAAHKGMPISEQEYLAARNDMLEVLEKMGATPAPIATYARIFLCNIVRV